MTGDINITSNGYYRVIDWLIDFYTDMIDITKNQKMKIDYINRKLKIYEEEYE